MDFVNKLTGGDKQQGEGQNQQQGQNEQGSSSSSGGGGGFLGGLGDKLNSVAGGGKESEKNEDYLDKGTFYSNSNCCTPLISLPLLPSYITSNPPIIFPLPISLCARTTSTYL